MKQILKFLNELKSNNDKTWFLAHKKDYEGAIEDFRLFTDMMISKVEEFDKSVKGVSAKNCVFRIYRDVRFSKDKSPYKTNFGAFIKGGGKNEARAGYYVHIEPGMSMLGGGIYMPPNDALLKIRKEIAKDSRPLKKILNEKKFKEAFVEIYDDEKLKTAPKGFSKDHPDIDLLCFKNYTVIQKLKDSEVTSTNFPEICAKSFKIMKPFNQYLNSII